LKPEVIIKSWERTGLEPWNPKLILQRAEQECVNRDGVTTLMRQIGRPSLSPELASRSSQLAADIVGHAARVERDICGGEEGVEIVDEPALEVVVLVDHLHEPHALREAGIANRQKALKRKLDDAKKKTRRSLLAECSAAGCDQKYDGRQKKKWDCCSNFGSQVTSPESALDSVECLFRVCWEESCRMKLKRHEKSCVLDGDCAETSSEGARRRTKRRKANSD
jgi:hypothetical protein